jgi:recombination protein RecR
MEKISPLLARLVRRLTRLPGIGERSAQRIALHLLSQDDSETRELSRLLMEAREKIGFCEKCGFYAETLLCPICSDPKRAQGKLCVVEQPVEVLSLERSGIFRGLYHVLGGVISPLDGVHPGDLSIDRLMTRVEDEQISEIILALSSSVEGETTSLYLGEQLDGRGVSVTRLARGLPAGSRLEYLDEATLSRAFEGRVKL